MLKMTTGTSDEYNKSVFKGEMSNPAGRPGKDTDMAATVLFLAGPGGVFYNEQVSNTVHSSWRQRLTAIDRYCILMVETLSRSLQPEPKQDKATTYIHLHAIQRKWETT